MNNLFRAVAFLDRAANDPGEQHSMPQELAVAIIAELQAADRDLEMMSRIATELAESCNRFRVGGEQALALLQSSEQALALARQAYTAANESQDALVAEIGRNSRIADELRTQLSDASERVSELIAQRNAAWAQLAELGKMPDAPEVGDDEPWHAPTQAS